MDQDIAKEFNLLLRRHLDLLAKTEDKHLDKDSKVKEDVQRLMSEFRVFVNGSSGNINPNIRSKIASYQEMWQRKAKKHGVNL